MSKKPLTSTFRNAWEIRTPVEVFNCAALLCIQVRDNVEGHLSCTMQFTELKTLSLEIIGDYGYYEIDFALGPAHDLARQRSASREVSVADFVEAVHLIGIVRETLGIESIYLGAPHRESNRLAWEVAPKFYNALGRVAVSNHQRVEPGHRVGAWPAPSKPIVSFGDHHTPLSTFDWAARQLRCVRNKLPGVEMRVAIRAGRTASGIEDLRATFFNEWNTMYMLVFWAGPSAEGKLSEISNEEVVDAHVQVPHLAEAMRALTLLIWALDATVSDIGYRSYEMNKDLFVDAPRMTPECEAGQMALADHFRYPMPSFARSIR